MLLWSEHLDQGRVQRKAFLSPFDVVALLLMSHSIQLIERFYDTLAGDIYVSNAWVITYL